ncbi:MAG: ACT domain-containing protein [Acidobacteriota bacterium]|nr:ACT domain-containing protein [Acidobacteriota bacterium]
MMVNGAFACAFEGDHSILVPIPDAGSHAGDDWACFRIDADIPLGAVGVAAEVTGLLAAADISVLVMSGYRTDYFLVRDSQRQPARDALIGGGHDVDVHRECV